jgi:hypothetical protein
LTGLLSLPLLGETEECHEIPESGQWKAGKLARIRILRTCNESLMRYHFFDVCSIRQTSPHTKEIMGARRIQPAPKHSAAVNTPGFC